MISFRYRAFLGIQLIVLLLWGCNKPTNYASTRTVTLPDSTVITLHSGKPRVLGLSPASTEMLFATVPDSQIVGVTHVCNYPEAVKGKPIVTTYPMDLEAIIKLKPEVVFTETGMTSPEHLARLQDFGIQTVLLNYESIADISANIELIGQICGASKSADSLAASLQNSIAKWQNRSYAKRPRVLVITWSEPIIAYGTPTLMSEKIKLAGGINAIQDLGNRPYPELSREYVLRLNPDVILGRDFHSMDSVFFSKYPELRQINAYRNKHIYPLTDDLSSRPSPRVLQSIEEIYEALSHF